MPSVSGGANKVPMIHVDDLQSLFRNVLAHAQHSAAATEYYKFRYHPRSVYCEPIFVNATDGGVTPLKQIYPYLSYKPKREILSDFLMNESIGSYLWSSDITFAQAGGGMKNLSSKSIDDIDVVVDPSQSKLSATNPTWGPPTCNTPRGCASSSQLSGSSE